MKSAKYLLIVGSLGLFVSSVLTGMPTSARAEKGGDVRVVVMQRAIDESQMGRALRADLEKEAKALKTKLDQGKKDLDAQKKKLEAQRSVLSEDAFAAQVDKVRKQEQGLAELARDSQQQLVKSRGTKLKSVVEKIDVAIAEYAKEAKIQVVIENDGRGVLYAADWMDITDDIIKKVNREHTGL